MSRDTVLSKPGQKEQSVKLNLLEVVGQSFSIGPLVDVALFLAIVAATAGAVAPLAVLLASIGMVAFSMVVAFYASETGGAGAIGDYIERAWGRVAGVGALGLYIISLIFSGAAGFSIAVGVLVSRFFVLYFDWDCPWWVGALVVVFAAWVLNLRGAAAATRVQLLLISVSVIPFLLTAVAAIIKAGSTNTLAVFWWGNPYHGDLFEALLFSVLLFGGFETAAALAEETDNPKRAIPLALVGTVVAVALLLILCSYAGTMYYGQEYAGKTWGNIMDGYAQMAENLLGAWAALWIRVGVLIDFFATCVGFTLAAARGLFSLGRAGLLPVVISNTNQRGAPSGAATLVLFFALLTIVGGLWVPAEIRYNTIFVAATGQALLLVVVYSALSFGALRLLWRSGKQPWWRWLVFVLATVTPLLAFYGTVVPLPEYPERVGFFAGMVAMVVVLLWLGWIRRKGLL